MSRTVAVTTLISRIRRRADIENETERFADAELVDEINASLANLHLILVACRGADYFEKKYLVYTTTVAIGTLPPEIIVGGFAEHDGAVVVVRGNITGPVGSAIVQVSVDNGLTFGAGIPTTPRVYTVPGTAVTITFPDTGTYVGDNGWTSTPEPPKTVAGQESMALPPDFMEVSAIETTVNAERVFLNRYNKNERAFLRTIKDWYGLLTPFPCYRVRGDRSRDGGEYISFVPIPSGSYPIELYYAPQVRIWTITDSIPLDSGHEEWLILDVAIKCRNKDDLDASNLIGKQGAVKEAITTVGEYRDASQAERVSDRTVNTAGILDYRRVY
jgi:hypothetical protein